MNRKLLNSIQGKLLLFIIPLVTVILITLGVITFTQSKNNQLGTTSEYSSQVVKARADEVSSWLLSIETELHRISEIPEVRSMNWGKMEDALKEVYEKRSDLYGLLFVVYPDGSYYRAGMGLATANLADRPYVQDIYINNKYVSITDPSVSKSTGEKKFNVAVPVINEGSVVGCLAVNVNLTTLSKIADQIKLGQDGFGFIIDSKGTIMAHPNESYHMTLNLLESSEEGFTGLDVIAGKMTKGESGSGIATNPDGQDDLIIYVPVNGSPGWSIGVSVPRKEIYAPVYHFLRLVIIMFSATLIILILIIILSTKRIIANPLHLLVKYISRIADGDLTGEIAYSSTDEVGEIAQSLKLMKERLSQIVTDIQNGAMNLAAASNQVSSSSQQLSQGANEQASSIEEVSSTMEQITANIEQNTLNASTTEKVSSEANAMINQVAEKSGLAAVANSNISEKIMIINDIAFQTNILALNAAVEAARAGEHGKGFAVVAAEVRKLAERSKAAADEIVSLAQEGKTLSNQAELLMKETLPKIANTSKLIQEISSASSEQNNGAVQVHSAIQQLNDVTQLNAASSEELATNAEELAGQAAQLKETISYFSVEQKSGHRSTNTQLPDLIE